MTMRTIIGVLICIFIPGISLGEDLLITNARIIDGARTTIEQGSLLARDGRIASVSPGPTSARDVTELDADGMTVLPGLIDTHTHLLIYSFARSQDQLDAWMETMPAQYLEEILAAGVTTVSNNGDFFPAILDVRTRLERGELTGPRMLIAGPVFTAPDGHPAVTVCQGNAFCREAAAVETVDGAAARARVRELVDAGVDAIKVVFHQPRMPSFDESVLAAIADEAQALGVPLTVHDQSFSGMITAARLGADRFAHTPYVDAVDPADAERLLAAAGLPVATTLGGVDRPLKPSNLKALHDAGVTLAFGTDAPPFAFGGYDGVLAKEWLALTELLTPEEVLATLTRNAAIYLGLDDDIGTLEPGKAADIVIVDGDPLDDISSLANVVAVIQRGELVVDKR
jgi:imidazolonepropionase-like amidohydrolase